MIQKLTKPYITFSSVVCEIANINTTHATQIGICKSKLQLQISPIMSLTKKTLKVWVKCFTQEK